MHGKSGPIALCGVLAALAAALMLLGGIFPGATYCAPLLASLVLIPAQEECGPRAAWGLFTAAALLSGRLCVDSYDSAKELTHEEDYSLSFLAGKYAKLSIREFENQQVGVAASCERRFPSCFRTRTVSVDCSSRCW